MVNLEIAELDLTVGELTHQDDVLRLDVEVSNVPAKFLTFVKISKSIIVEKGAFKA